MQLRENAEQYSGLKPRAEANGRGGGLGDWRAWARLNWRRDDRESDACYALFLAVFVADFSLAALAFPLALLGYALLAQPPSRRFWQVGGCMHHHHCSAAQAACMQRRPPWLRATRHEVSACMQTCPVLLHDSTQPARSTAQAHFFLSWCS